MEKKQGSDDYAAFWKNRKKDSRAKNRDGGDADHQLARELDQLSSFQNLSSEYVPGNLAVAVDGLSINGGASSSSGDSELGSTSTTTSVGFDNDSANGNNCLAVGPSRMSINGGASSSNYSQGASTSGSTPMGFGNGSENGNENAYLHELINRPALPYLQALNNNHMGANRLVLRPNTGYQPVQMDHGGSISAAAMTCRGCVNLRKILEQGNLSVNEIIITEVMNDLPFLMIHQIGYKFTVSLFESCDEQQMNRILQWVMLRNPRNFAAICQHCHGSCAAKALLANASSPQQQTLIVTFVREHIICFTNSQKGQEVLLSFIRIVDDYFGALIMNEMSRNCEAIATDRVGCVIVQQLIHRVTIESAAQFLVRSVVANSLFLSEDEFGNYVVQHLVTQASDGVAQGILERLSGKFSVLAKNKYGSNVVERCLKEFKEREVVMIITELMDSEDLMGIIRDPYGNFVIQTALAEANVRGFRRLVSEMAEHIQNLPLPALLSAHPYGRKVLRALHQLLPNLRP